MNSRTTARFRRAFAELPIEIRLQAEEAYELFQANPRHPSLHFKRVHSMKPVYSVRITRSHRALAVLDEEIAVWFWIGPHEEYERILSTL